MSTIKRCISLLLVLGILFGVLAPAAQAAPVEDAASVNTDNVTIEGTNGFGNLLAQEITEDQQESETENGAYSGGYSVTDLEIVDNVATVSYNSMEEAQLVVALHTEDGMQLLTSATVIVTPDATEATVTFEGEMPEYFMASAYLLDRYDYSPLCASYDTPMYTREMQALLASTVNDYDPEKVLNLDEDETTNFAVYADSTIVIEAVEGINTVASIDDENATYVIKNADEQVTSLAEGNVFVYPYAEEEILIVKVADIKVDGTVVTITGDELEMEEVFAYLKLETEADLDNAEVDNSELDEGVEYIGIDDEQGDIQPAAFDGTGELTKAYKWKVSWDNDAGSEVNVTLKYTLGVEVDYYISLSYTRIELSLMNKVNVTGEIKSELETDPIPVEARLSRISIPFLGGAAAVEFTPSFVAEFSVSVKVDAEIRAEIGFYFDNHSFRPTYSSSCKGFELEAEGELFVGLKLTPEIEVLGGTVVEAKLTGKIGAQLSGKPYPRELDENADVVHGCEGCVDGDISLIIEIKASLKVLGKNALKNALKYQTSHELTFLDFKWKFADFYICYEHGKFLAWGVCPNNLYRTTVCVTDRDENPIPDAEVTVGDQTQMTDKNGIAVFYLRYLEYTVEAEYGELMNRRTIMANKAQKVKIPLYEGVESEGFFGFNEGIITDDGLLVDSGFCGDDVRWELYSSGLLNILGSGEITKFESSSEVPWDDYRSSIRRIYIENGVTNIGRWGLYQCDNLYEIDLPDSVTVIDRSAFSGCDNLRRVHIPSSVKIIDRSAFYNCGNLSGISIPKNVTTIGRTAFYNCDNLINVNIPDSVVTIGEGAFEGCSNLTAATIGNGVIIIDKNAFYDCANLTGVTIGNSVITIGENAFYDCHKLRNINIPASVETIAENAFYHCDDLPNVKIPASVTTIGEDAFYSCDNLMGIFVDEQNPNYSSDEFGVLFDKEKTILIQCPSGIIGNYIIPDTVETVRNKSFLNCDNLTSVTVGRAVVTIGSDAFKTCDNLLDVYVSDSVTSIGGYAFSQCSNLTNVSIGSGVTSIGDHAFSFCDKIEEIDLPDSLVSLGASAFYDCDGLQYMIIPEDITKIKANTFFWCKSLEYVYIPASVVSVGYMAFSNCDKLAEVYYGGSEEQWQSISVDKMNGALTSAIIYYNCTAFDAPANLDSIDGNYSVKETEVFSGSGRADAPTLNALYPGDYGTEVTDTYILKTAAFQDLVPNEQYVLLAMVSVEAEDPLASDNLLFIDQAEAAEDGTLVFQYVQRTPYEVSYVVACGASNKNLNEAVITFPEMTEDSELHVVNPTVEYDGKTLTEGLDYIITGTVAYAERGEYTCYIRGIHNYTGLVECAYTVDAHEHSFTTYVSDGNATCTEDGTKTAKCDHCDATDTILDVGSALGHNMGSWETTVPATCTENGEEMRTCSRCDHSESRVIEAVGHHWDKGVVTREPTEDAEGERLYTCTACGATRMESIPVIGHEHHYEAVVTTPTCTERGYTTHTCAACGDSYITDELPALGHDWHGTKCSRCDETRRNPFVDVADDSFCIDAVLWAVEEGITKGITDTRFAPDDLTTRGQIVTFLWRAAGEPEPASNANPFTDVKEEDFCYKAVLWAVDNGITKGMTETIFAPNSSCTRAQAVTFLHRYMGKPAYTITGSGFSDVTDPEEFCYDAILWAVENEITGGLGDGTFGVDQTCTRGQIVTFLYRTLA